jgi:hypothetical protein
MTETRRIALTPDTGAAPSAGMLSETDILSRLVAGWPGLLMLVAPDRSVLAMSVSLAQLLGRNAHALGLLACTRVTSCGEAQGCCLDFASGSDDISEPALALIQRPHASPLVVLTRVEPLDLRGGSRAYLVHLDPLTPLPGPATQFALDSLLLQLRVQQADRTAWLRLLSNQWIRPLVGPKWIGWLAEYEDGAAELLLSVGRLPKGAKPEQIVAAAHAARRESPGNTSPFTLLLPTQPGPHPPCTCCLPVPVRAGSCCCWGARMTPHGSAYCTRLQRPRCAWISSRTGRGLKQRKSCPLRWPPRSRRENWRC